MPDEVRLYACLESPLYGGLLQTLDTAAAGVQADTAAGRIFSLDHVPICHCVLSRRLKLTRTQELALDNWPHDDGCLFELLRRVRPPSGVFRPRDHMDEKNYAARAVFRKLEASEHVTDCLCESVQLDGEVWGLLCYLRCAPSLPFTEQQVDRLRRLHPTVQRRLQTALRRELRPNGPTGEPGDRHVPLSQLLARLSRTEGQVLGYLRTSLTEKQIADELERSHHTVHVHVKNIYRKFGISSRKQLMELFMDE